MKLNTVYNEDWRETTERIPDNSIDLVIIDPPYRNVVSAEWDREGAVTSHLSRELFRITKESSSLYVWCGIGEKSQSLIEWFNIFNEKWYFKDLVTWKKQRGYGGRKGWLYAREEILWYVKNNDEFIWNEKNQYSEIIRGSPAFYGKAKSKYKRIPLVWTDITEETFNTSKEFMNRVWRSHLTPKPIKAIKRIIKAHTKEGDIVADFFMGSGTTAAACIETNRHFIGSEINPEYHSAILERIEWVRGNL